jgi:hypothetical protein
LTKEKKKQEGKEENEKQEDNVEEEKEMKQRRRRGRRRIGREGAEIGGCMSHRYCRDSTLVAMKPNDAIRPSS